MLKGEECCESITVLPAASPTMACCGLWNAVTRSHMLIRLTYVAFETIKEPGGPRGRRTSLRPEWGVLDKRQVVALCMSLGCSMEREGQGSDWDSLAGSVPPDGETACGHSHLVGD